VWRLWRLVRALTFFYFSLLNFLDQPKDKDKETQRWMLIQDNSKKNK